MNGEGLELNGEVNLRALSSRHGDWFWGVCGWFGNGLSLWLLRREGERRILLREEGRTSRSATEELECGVAEKINEHAEDQAQG